MITVFAAYYKQIGGGREFVKFFESRQDAEVYLTSDEYYGASKDQFELDYRFKQLEEKFEIVERSLVDVLNEIYAWGKDTDARLDLHSM
jgi:hypothetical protein